MLANPTLTDQYRYTLAAVIDHYGEDARGHYSIILFLKERIVTFDGKNVTTKSKSILKSKTFKESTHLLFYTREEIRLGIETLLVFKTPSEMSKKGLRVRHAELMTLLNIFKGTVDINSNSSHQS